MFQGWRVGVLAVACLVVGCGGGGEETPIDGAVPDAARADAGDLTGIWLGGADGAWAIALDRDNVYFTTNNGRVMQLAKAGGEPIELASGQGEPNAIAVDEANVYWVNYNGGIGRAPIGGGTVEARPTAPNGAYTTLAMQGDTLYYTRYTDLDGAVLRMPKTGGGEEVFVGGQIYPAGLAVDATHVYWSGFSEMGIQRVPLTGGTPELFNLSPWVRQGLTMDNDYVYWLQESSGTAARVGRRLKQGGSEEPVVVDLLAYNGGGNLVLDGAYVYWSAHPCSLAMAPQIIGSGDLEVTDLWACPFNIAIDDVDIYFTDPGRGLFRMGK
jgi:hypothetical protein